MAEIPASSPYHRVVLDAPTLTRDHYVIHLASRARIDSSPCFIIYLPCPEYTRAWRECERTCLRKWRFTRPRAIYCATPRKHSGARHSLDARVSARQAELYESPVKIFLLVRKDSLYISRRCNPTEHECNSFPQVGRCVRRLPETTNKKNN